MLTATLFLAAALSVKYQDWAASPQAYFMTKAERAQWATLRSDAEAEAFVNGFLAKRGPAFPAAVADRVANADKYLTIGSTPGSRTLRGKVIVVLGPPAALKNETKQGRVTRSTTAGGYMSAIGASSQAGIGTGGGPSVQEMVQVSEKSAMSEKRGYLEYSITYPADKLPAAYSGDLTIKVDVDPKTGEDWAPDRKAQAQLDELFEAVATALATPAKPAQ